ncbi:MAG: hypothetical protein R2712_13015 [Vicinamibacterales bacterium]
MTGTLQAIAIAGVLLAGSIAVMSLHRASGGALALGHVHRARRPHRLEVTRAAGVVDRSLRRMVESAGMVEVSAESGNPTAGGAAPAGAAAGVPAAPGA